MSEYRITRISPDDVVNRQLAAIKVLEERLPADILEQSPVNLRELRSVDGLLGNWVAIAPSGVDKHGSPSEGRVLGHKRFKRITGKNA